MISDEEPNGGKAAKESFLSKVGQKFKAAVSETAQYLDELPKRIRLTKVFDSAAELLVNLDDGTELPVHIRSNETFLVKVYGKAHSEGRYVPKVGLYGHTYYRQGNLYILSTVNAETVKYRHAKVKDFELDCLAIPYETVLDPIRDIPSALVAIKKMINGYAPNYLSLHKSELSAARKGYADFEKAASAKMIFDFMHAYVKNLAKFLPDGARLAASIVSGLMPKT